MSRQRIVVREYASLVFPAPAHVGRDLQAAAGDHLSVGFGLEPGTITITAAQHVGTIVTPDVEVLIRPKVPLENLFTMLSVGVLLRAELNAHRSAGLTGDGSATLDGQEGVLVRTAHHAVLQP